MRSVAPVVLGALLAACSSSSQTDSDPSDSSPSDGAAPDVSVGDDAIVDDAASSDASTIDSADTTTIADATTDAREAGGNDATYVDEAGTWVITWHDEFDGADGSEVDRTKWTYDDPQSGKWNQELEYYATGTSNAEQRGGNLVITAKATGASAFTCWYGACRYTSARLVTKGLFSQKYGRFAARMKIPRGQGMWPAFWALGDDIDEVSWPACGEIDVMENIGKAPKTDYGTLHAKGFDKGGSTDAAAPLADDFHVYAVEWDASGIRFFLDDATYATITPHDVPSGGTWAFDHPFFLLLNVAVGGNWPGSPDATTTFPQTMAVDWVRVYAKQ